MFWMTPAGSQYLKMAPVESTFRPGVSSGSVASSVASGLSTKDLVLYLSSLRSRSVELVLDPSELLLVPALCESRSLMDFGETYFMLGLRAFVSHLLDTSTVKSLTMGIFATLGDVGIERYPVSTSCGSCK